MRHGIKRHDWRHAERWGPCLLLSAVSAFSCCSCCPALAANVASDTLNTEPSAKRIKIAQAAAAASGTAGVINQQLLSSDNRKQLRKDHDTAIPYTHLVLKDLCDEQLLRAVRDEVIHNISATYKETDLFKVFQTGKSDR